MLAKSETCPLKDSFGEQAWGHAAGVLAVLALLSVATAAVAFVFCAGASQQSNDEANTCTRAARSPAVCSVGTKLSTMFVVAHVIMSQHGAEAGVYSSNKTQLADNGGVMHLVYNIDTVDGLIALHETKSVADGIAPKAGRHNDTNPGTAVCHKVTTNQDCKTTSPTTVPQTTIPATVPNAQAENVYQWCLKIKREFWPASSSVRKKRWKKRQRSAPHHLEAQRSLTPGLSSSFTTLLPYGCTLIRVF